MEVPSSAPKQSMPEVHGLVGSTVLKSTGALLSMSTQPILEVVVYKGYLSHQNNLQPPSAQGICKYTAICAAV